MAKELKVELVGDDARIAMYCVGVVVAIAIGDGERAANIQRTILSKWGLGSITKLGAELSFADDEAGLDLHGNPYTEEVKQIGEKLREAYDAINP